MRPSRTDDYAEFDDPIKREAARFLFADFTSEKGHNASDDEHLHAKPMIRGMTDEERLHTWIEVAKANPDRVTKADRDALRKRLRELSVDEPVEFTPASQTDAGAAAVADGGAMVDDDGQPNSAVSREAPNTAVSQSDRWAIGPDQEAMTYEDEAAFQSKKNDTRRTVEDLVETVDEAESALDTQYSKDVVPLHTVELLAERLEELRS